MCATGPSTSLHSTNAYSGDYKANYSVTYILYLNSSLCILNLYFFHRWHLMAGKNDDNSIYVFKEGAFRFLYSMHSSLEEIEAFVQLIKPKKITPISQPSSMNCQKVENLNYNTSNK